MTGSAELYGNTGNLELPCQINAGGELTSTGLRIL